MEGYKFKEWSKNMNKRIKNENWCKFTIKTYSRHVILEFSCIQRYVFLLEKGGSSITYI